MRREAAAAAAIRERAAAGQATRLSLAIAGAYMLLGIAWIVLSDGAVAAIAPDASSYARAQQFKGVAYVFVTGALLALLVRHGWQRLLRARALAESNELQVRDLFERHPQPMWVYDAATRCVLTANEAACRRYGLAESEFVGLPIAALEAGGESAGGAVCHQTRRGERLFVRLSTHELPFRGRAAVLAMADDVTQQVLAERRVRQHERRLDQLHQSLGEVLWLASPDGREVYHVSPAFETIYGRPPAELMADSSIWLSAVHADDRRIADASMHTLLAVGRSTCEYRVVRPDGQIRWVSDRKRLIVDEDGRATMIGGIAEDITAAKERDAALATTHAELERRVAARTAELAEANAELDAFTRTAAHDLKSPLAGIAGLAALLRMRHDAALGEGGRRMVTQIERATQQMAGLVNDLLALSRSTTTKLVPRDVDLAALAQELIAELRAQHPERQVVFEAPPRLWVHGDPGLARSLLANLLGNAWKFSARRERATIRLAAEPEGERVRIAVEDDGAGFDAAAAKTLFQPFQRFHPASEFAGTGIGLVTCARIVRRHGGRIDAESEPGRGAVFRFTLPAPEAVHTGH